MSRAGRKKKSNVKRDKNGKSRGETGGIAPEVLEVRERHLEAIGVPLTFEKKEHTSQGWQMVSKRTATDRLSGFTLGLLMLRGRADKGDPGGITMKQYDAGDAWASLVRRHAQIMGYSLSRPSPSFVYVSGGGGNPWAGNCTWPECECQSPCEEREQVLNVRRRYKECFDALMKEGREHRAGTAVGTICYAVCIENRPITDLTEVDYGNLRVGLNALGRALG